MLRDMLRYLWSRRTTVLGYLIIILGALSTATDLLPDKGIKWIILINGILTAILGHYNNSQAQQLVGGVPGVPSKEGGFIRPLLLALLLALSASVVIAPMAGCTHTYRAVRNADTPTDYALVFLAGYDAALKTMNDLRARGVLDDADLERVRALEKQAYPLIAPIPKLQAAYEKSKSATDAAALQKAVDDAVLAAAEFVRAVQELARRI